jgi:hypothetical protein
MAHSEVDKARLLADKRGVEISLVLPNVAKGSQLVIQAVVTQDAVAGQTERALAHTSWVFDPPADDAVAVFTVPLAEGSRDFDPQVGIEARATATYTCWSTLDHASGENVAAGWTWELSAWG